MLLHFLINLVLWLMLYGFFDVDVCVVIVLLLVMTHCKIIMSLSVGGVLNDGMLVVIDCLFQNSDRIIGVG